MSVAPSPKETIDRLTAENPLFAIGYCQVRGVELPYYVNAPATVRDLLLQAFETHGDTEFLVFGQERYSFADIKRRVFQLAHALVDEFGVARGDRVAISMRNTPEWVIAFFAIEMVGGIAVGLNSWWQTEELGYGLDDSGAKLIFVDERRLSYLNQRLEQGGLRAIAVRCNDQLPAAAVAWNEVLEGKPIDQSPTVEVAHDDPAMILYTSGSTGRPKGVLSEHRAIVNQNWLWLHITLAAAELQAAEAGTPEGGEPEAPPQPSLLLTIPLFHVNGLLGNLMNAVVFGGKLVMMERWDPVRGLQLIQDEQVTSLQAVPTMVADLMNVPDRDKYDLSSLTVLGGGGAAFPEERVREMDQWMPNLSPSTGYGMTETNAAGTVSAGEIFKAKPGSCGCPGWTMVDIQLVDEQGRVYDESQPGQRGEIWIRSVSNMREYWNKPEATAATLVDGWVKTGDLGEFDEDGFLYIVGRIKEIIIRGGENISCNEIEAALHDNPAVFETCVFGVPDDRLGEAVAAVVVLRDGASVSEDELRSFLGGKLADYKIPQYFKLTGEKLPRIASGKIDRVGVRSAFSV